MRKLTLLIALCCWMMHGIAQDAPQKPLRVGMGLLGAAYSGDLAQGEEAFTRFYPGIGVSLQFVNEKLISPQLNTGFGKFVAQDRDLAAVEGVQPNTFVATNFFFVDFRLRARFLREKAVVPYLSAGIGLLGYTPKDMNGNNLVDNVGTRAEGEIFGSLTAGFPLSLGTEIYLNHLLSVGMEYTFRPTGSDYLDNVGMLGTKAGKDKIHSVLLSMYFTIDPGGTLQPRTKSSSGMRGRDRR